MTARSRSELIRLIVEGHAPLPALLQELATYPWDAPEPLVTLRRDHVARILQRYLDQEWSAADVEAWAEAIEIRDDVGFAEDDQVQLQRVVFVLANPAVNGALSPAKAAALLAEIRARTA